MQYNQNICRCDNINAGKDSFFFNFSGIVILVHVLSGMINNLLHDGEGDKKIYYPWKIIHVFP